MEPKKSTDAVTLKNVSGAKKEPKLLLETAKPSMDALPQSSLLQRLRGFLPEMQAANSDLSEAPVMDFEVVHCEESSSDSDTSTDDSSDEAEGEEIDEHKMKTEPTGASTGRVVQIDINLFREKGAIVSDGDPAAQSVEELPQGFQEQSSSQNGPTETEQEKKLIEVIEP